MRKNFIITAHKPTKALFWTVNYLSSFQENTVIIHYDKKSDINEVLVLGRDNVLFLADRSEVTWGSVSQIHATLNLLRKSAEIKCDFIFFISGDDIPIMDNSDMNNFLHQNQGVEFIHYQDSRNEYVPPESRVIYNYPNFFYDRSNGFFNRALKKIYKSFFLHLSKNRKIQSLRNSGAIGPFYKGTNWFTLTESTVLWLLNYIDDNPSVIDAFNKTLCADEVFFHTLIAMKDDVVIFNNQSLMNNCLRYIDWSSGPQFPRHLNLKDLEKLKVSKCFFARKVDDNTSDEDFYSFKNLVVKDK